MTHRSKKILLSSLLLAGSLVVSVLLGEALIRIFAPQDLESSQSWYEAHPVYRFRHRPKMNRQARWYEQYNLRTNSRGLRGSREFTYNDTAFWRVIVHGDSFTFGNGVDEEELFVTRAERRLHESGIPEAQVINLGVSAHGSSLEYLYFLEEGRRYRPNVVVVAIFLGNDYLDDYRDGAFSLESGKLVYHPYEVSWMKRMTNSAIYQFLASHSHLLVFLRTRLVSLPGQAREVDAYTNTEIFDDLYALNELVLLRFEREIRAIGAEGVFLLLPTPWQLLTEPSDVEDYFPQADRYRESLLQTCAREGLKCLDILPTMRLAAEDPWELFLHDESGQPDFHYNAEGHAIVADLLAKELYRLYLSSHSKQNQE